jgi:hypothetical protein
MMLPFVSLGLGDGKWGFVRADAKERMTTRDVTLQ